MNNAFIVVDLGYGDSSKGATVDALVYRYKSDLVIRFNGGPQAAHNVMRGEKSFQHHTFSQFGSGAFSGARTLLSYHVYIEPYAIVREGEILTSKSGIDHPFENLYISEYCPVITPFHILLNRYQESKNNHGSCGVGFGAAVEHRLNHPHEALYAKDLRNYDLCLNKLKSIQEYCYDKIEDRDFIKDDYCLASIATEYQNLCKRFNLVNPKAEDLIIRLSNNPVFEGAQGILLDQDHGFHPHTTWSDTTPKNAFDLLQGQDRNVITVGCTRAYSVRHGAGPFVSHDPELDKNLAFQDKFNKYNPWQKDMRYGCLDLNTLRYASCIATPNCLSISHLDVIKKTQYYKYCSDYQCDYYEDPDHNTFNLLNIDFKSKTLEGKAALTKDLFNCSPIINEAKSFEEFRELFSSRISPVMIEAYGPETKDRKFLF